MKRENAGRFGTPKSRDLLGLGGVPEADKSVRMSDGERRTVGTEGYVSNRIVLT
jgi:hypothetical protein